MRRAAETIATPTPAKSRRCVLPIGVLLVACLTLASGAIQGRMSNRWGVPADLLAAGNKLEDIPSQFGNWQLQSSEELDEPVAKMLDCAGYLVREYLNKESGQTVKVAVLLGRPGPMSVHRPEICFSSRDYEQQGDRQRVAIPSAGSEKDDEFWAVTFRANNLEADMLSTYYGWSKGRRWRAVDDPRFTFADTPFLYKIQLASLLPPGVDPQTYDPCRQFLTDFLPVASPFLVDSAGK